MENVQSCTTKIRLGQSAQVLILRTGQMMQNLNTKFDESMDGETITSEGVKIDMEDIEDEIAYWNSALVCYVIGANPPLSVFEGYARRI